MVFFSLPDHAAAPKDLKKEIEVRFKELDNAEAMNLGRARVFFQPDLKGAAPTGGWTAKFKCELENERVEFQKPRRGVRMDVSAVVSEMSSRWGGGGFFGNGAETSRDVFL